MRKFLLFTLVISFLGTVSCSKDEEHTEVSQEEKEYLVKQTLIEFNKSAVKTGKYKEYINSLRQKSTEEQLSEAEKEALLQEFLGDQTNVFLDLYYQLEALNLTPQEFYDIADQFEYLRLNILVNVSKNPGDCGTSSSLYGTFLDWISGCPLPDDANDETRAN